MLICGRFAGVRTNYFTSEDYSAHELVTRETSNNSVKSDSSGKITPNLFPNFYELQKFLKYFEILPVDTSNDSSCFSLKSE
jgi:hypothetical protein